MACAPGGEDRWLIHEISSFNVPVARRSFPKAAFEALREALDITLSFALSLHKTSPLSFNTSALFVLFPRLILKPLHDGCLGTSRGSSPPRSLHEALGGGRSEPNPRRPRSPYRESKGSNCGCFCPVPLFLEDNHGCRFSMRMGARPRVQAGLRLRGSRRIRKSQRASSPN